LQRGQENNILEAARNFFRNTLSNQWSQRASIPLVLVPGTLALSNPTAGKTNKASLGRGMPWNKVEITPCHLSALHRNRPIPKHN